MPSHILSLSSLFLTTALYAQSLPGMLPIRLEEKFQQTDSSVVIQASTTPVTFTAGQEHGSLDLVTIGQMRLPTGLLMQIALTGQPFEPIRSSQSFESWEGMLNWFPIGDYSLEVEGTIFGMGEPDGIAVSYGNIGRFPTLPLPDIPQLENYQALQALDYREDAEFRWSPFAGRVSDIDERPAFDPWLAYNGFKTLAGARIELSWVGIEGGSSGGPVQVQVAPVVLPPTATSYALGKSFLAPDAQYAWELAFINVPEGGSVEVVRRTRGIARTAGIVRVEPTIKTTAIQSEGGASKLLFTVNATPGDRVGLQKSDSLETLATTPTPLLVVPPSGEMILQEAIDDSKATMFFRVVTE